MVRQAHHDICHPELVEGCAFDRTLHELLVNCSTNQRPGGCPVMWTLNVGDPAVNPLVSVIVRTKDRPTLLKRALQSIAGQTYRPIEVVVVNDGGCELDRNELEGILRGRVITLYPARKKYGTGTCGQYRAGKCKRRIHRVFG